MADKGYPLKSSGRPPQTSPIRPTNIVQSGGTTKPYSLAGGWADVRGKVPAIGRQPVVQPPGYQPGSMQLPRGYPVGQGTPATAAAPAAPAPSTGGYNLGSTPTAQKFSNFRASRPGMASGLNSMRPAQAATPSPTGRQLVNQHAMATRGITKGVAPQVARAAAPSAASSGVSGPTVWSALHPNAGPTGQQVMSALHPSAPPAAPAAPAAAAPAATPAASGGIRAGLASKAGNLARGIKNAAPGMALSYALSFNADPENNFRALQGLPAGPSHMDPFTEGVNNIPLVGPIAVGGANTINSLGDLVRNPRQYATEFGRGLDRIGSVLSGHGDPAIQAQQHQQSVSAEPVSSPGVQVPSQWSTIASHGNADQLNSLYEHLGIGGQNPQPEIHAAQQQTQAALSSAAPKSANAPVVTNPGSQQAPPNPGLSRAMPDHWDGLSYAPGPHGWQVKDQVGDQLSRAMDTAMYQGDYNAAQSLGQAVSNYNLGKQSYEPNMINANASRLHAEASMQHAKNPHGDLSDPVNLAAADAQLQAGGNLIGTAQAHGKGLGPGGTISQNAMPAYTQIRHPEFSSFVGNKEWSLDQLRDQFNQSRLRFGAGDQQLGELQNYVRQLLQSRFTPEELDSETSPGLGSRLLAPIFGADQGVIHNRSFLHELGVR